MRHIFTVAHGRFSLLTISSGGFRDCGPKAKRLDLTEFDVFYFAFCYFEGPFRLHEVPGLGPWPP